MISLTRLTIRRARQERLAQIAGSLTFTTLLSVVPFVSVALALFTRFPVFQRFEAALEEHLLKSLLPADIARTVLRLLNQFAANAGGLTLLGSLFLVAAAVMLLLTVENALNQIWAVKRNRPLLRRVGLYLLLLAIGPPLLGASLWATSLLAAASAGLIGVMPSAARHALAIGPVLLGAACLGCLFYFVPNTRVRRRDAIVGGLIAGVAFELGKRGFAAYLVKLPTYRAVYGAFWTFPLFLLWVYFSWFVTLAAALLTAALGQTRAR
jgi:membrane protein